MAYSPTTWEDGVTALSAENFNNIEEGVQEAMAKSEGNNDMWSYIRNLVYPVGSIYMSATLSTPEAVEAVLGGTWEAWGSGKVPVGVDTADTSFNTVEKTGGQKDAINVSHSHSLTAHKHGFTATKNIIVTSDTKYLRTSATLSTRQAKMDLDTSASYYYLRSDGAGLSKETVVSSGTNEIVGETAVNASTCQSAGSSGTNKNLQPYITCYMYKRTA